MTALTTNSAGAWSPDIQAFTPADVIPDALVFKGSTVVTTELEGDAPVARIPWVDDASASFVAEGDPIEESDPTLAEVVVPTAKVSQLIRVSREQWTQDSTAGLLSTSAARAVTRAANTAFISQAAPVSPQITPPTGIGLVPGIITGDTITDNLDPLANLIAQIEANGGQPAIIFADPLAWGGLRTLKLADSSNAALLGAGTEDQAKRLLGVEVVTSPAVPVGKLLVVDPLAVASAVGNIQVATSEHAYFAADSIGLRVTWRLGWAVQHANRIGVVSVALPSSSSSAGASSSASGESSSAA